jgi:hypothetical protein
LSARLEVEEKYIERELSQAVGHVRLCELLSLPQTLPGSRKVLSVTYHPGLDTGNQEPCDAHGARLQRTDESVTSHVVHRRIPLLKSVHHHHFGVKIASKARKEDRVAALLNYVALWIGEHGADAIVPCARRD